jgi:hypothetical protein
LASAKLQAVRGQLDVVNTSGERRRVLEGAALYPGETVEASPNAEAVLIFRDESKIRLGASSRLRIDDFVYLPESPSDGRFAVSLLAGNIRAITGNIAQAAPQKVAFRMSTALVSVRGTELSLGCSGDCAGAIGAGVNTGTRVFTHAGQVLVQWSPTSGAVLPELPLALNQGAFLPSGGSSAQALNPPNEFLASPSDVPFLADLFNSRPHNEQKEGLYVTVRDGHIEIVSGQEVLQLGRGETGFSGGDNQTYRPQFVPLFVDFDRVPLPNVRNPELISLLVGSGVRPNAAPICR